MTINTSPPRESSLSSSSAGTSLSVSTGGAVSGDSVACAHCGLPSPPPRSGEESAFCCEGCRGAYHLIHGWGLEDYYALRDREGGPGAGPVETAGVWEELDDPASLGAGAPRACGEDLLRARLAVGGLHCGACAWLIERAARRHPGFHSARVRLNDHTVEIVYRPSATRLSRIASDLGKLGYRLMPLVEGDQPRRHAAENRALLSRIAVAGFCAVNAMWIAVALYAGWFSGIAAEHETALRWVGVMLGLIAVAFPGRTFFRGALASLRTRTPHMDLPVAVGIGVGAVSGLVAVISGRGEVYFDSVATLVFFLLVGRWVQFRQQRRAADSVSLLMRLTPRLARRVEASGAVRRVMADQLRPGDRVRVAPGETFPADGIVADGESSVDRSLVTGESRPVRIGPSATVEAGIANLESTVDVEVTATGQETRVGRITRLIEDAAANRSPTVQLADSIGGRFVVTVIGLAAITVAGWWQYDPTDAIEHGVALLIVACPCALALATPLALAVAIGRLARRKLLVRGGDVLERLAQPGVVWFDKTGTLTAGRPQLVEWDGDENALRDAAAVEDSLAHPVAEAVRGLAQSRDIDVPAAVDVRQRTGMGAEGTVEGRRVLVGSEALLRSAGVLTRGDVEARIGGVTAGGNSPLLVAVDGEVVAVGGLGDPLRGEAADAVSALRERGWRIGILSGDHPSVVDRVAGSLGIERERAIGGAAPEEKLAWIEGSKADGATVLMVGDGVNDAAALAAADVGVSLRGGAAASLEAAPVYLQAGGLGSLVDLVDASRRTVRTIRRNFAFSLGYNALAVGLAMAGLIHPLIAAILMPASSLTVLTTVLLSKTCD